MPELTSVLRRHENSNEKDMTKNYHLSTTRPAASTRRQARPFPVVPKGQGTGSDFKNKRLL
jgi:hypothetical protein